LIEARADGYVPAARTLTVLGGADMQLDLALAQLSSEPAGVAVPSVMVASERGPLTAGQGAPHADDGGRHWYKNPWLWTAVGVVVVGAGVGTGVALAHRGGGTSAAYGGSTGQVGSGP